MNSGPALPLEGLYLHLVRNGFPLSVRDYLDAQSALRRGYGLHSRDELRWLCESLWARNDQERLRLDRLFRAFPWPKPEAVNTPEGAGDSTAPTAASAGSTAGGQAQAADRDRQSPAIEFASPTDTGVGLPQVQWRAGQVEPYIFTPRPPISQRTLTIAWRRFRLAQRAGPRVELDLEATIAGQCRQGILAEPVLLPARRNQARLLVLMDVSPSIAPWLPLHSLIADSLQGGQLAHAALYFFDNTPEDGLYDSVHMNRSVPLAEALRRNPHCAVLILSDAGAARGRFDRGRLARTRQFFGLDQLKADWQPIAWANPMPRPRWVGTTAERIAQLPGVGMVEFSDDGLIHAIDYLRGKRSV